MLMIPQNQFQQFGFDGEPLDFSTPRVWAALIARPSKEQDAMDRLKEYKLFAYWPCYLKQQNCGSGRRRSIFTPVIPGYIFIAVREGSNQDPWGVVRQTPGVIGYVRNGFGSPALLSDADIEVIRNIEGRLNIPPPAELVHTFKVGDKVHFLDDIYKQWPHGKVKALAEGNRISVEVPLMGRVVPVTVFPHQIEAM